MRDVRIAELKAKLSQYLRLVRGGNEVRVLDRDTPVARIIQERPGLRRLEIRKARYPWKTIYDLPRPPRMHVKTDSLSVLLAMRKDHR